ncbi:rRNA maturation RNase YbeY [Sulfoacidibacillus thermotolerans]|uniref:rRNA maturation RNase YbeY n=1 Tax=Sulfoacidibacillus thermotolerans TaxID=1765684 RepID=UPI001FEB10C3
MKQAEDLVIHFSNEVLDAALDAKRMEEIANAVCKEIAMRADLPKSEVSITLVDNATIQELNRNYRDRDQVTDVLSFALLEGEDEPQIADPLPIVTLGDIILCWPRIHEQAAEYGHSVEREFAFLTAHGFYHLLGYDHQTEETEQEMMRLQEAVLSALGFER